MSEEWTFEEWLAHKRECLAEAQQELKSIRRRCLKRSRPDSDNEQGVHLCHTIEEIELEILDAIALNLGLETRPSLFRRDWVCPICHPRGL
jgi:hypothetical protein